MKLVVICLFLLYSVSAFARPETCSEGFVKIISDELDRFNAAPINICSHENQHNQINGCKASNANCKFYECFNSLYPDCDNNKGVANYAWSYGRFYCNKYRCITYDNFTDNVAKQWMEDVMQCLQEALEPYSLPGKHFGSCKELSDYAFDSHKPCYLGQGKKKKFFSLCDISTWNQIQVMRTVWKGVNSKKSLDQSIDVATNCAVQVAAKITHKMINHPICVGQPPELMPTCLILNSKDN